MWRYCWLKAALLAGLYAGVSAVPAAMAQEPETEETAEARKGADVIVVTATRREENILDVPLAISAYGGDELQKAGIDDFKEIMSVSPSFQAATSVSEVQGLSIRVRGVGTQGLNPGFESAVGVFIDGVYRSRPGAALSEMLDIERIELLRGPQGTLFGRNTTAGALNIVTLKPEFEFGGYVEATYGNYNLADVRGSITGPIAEGLAGRFSAYYQHRDGLIEDLFTDEEYNDKNRYTLKGQLLFAPTDNFDIRIIADYRDQEEACCFPVTLKNGLSADILNTLGAAKGFPGPVQLDPPDPFGRKASKTPGIPITQDVEDRGISAEATWRGEHFNIVSITAFRDFQSFQQGDIDFTALDLLRLPVLAEGIEAFTQELRVQGEWKWLDWLVGGYFIDEKITVEAQAQIGADFQDFMQARIPLITPLLLAEQVLGPGACANGACWGAGMGTGLDRWVSDNMAWSVFTHNIISFTDNLKLALGARFNVDEKHAVSDLSESFMPGCEAMKQHPAVNSQILWFQLTEALSGVPGENRRFVDALLGLGCLSIVSPSFDYDLKKDDDEWTGTANLSYQFDDGTLAYVSYSRGFKAGGIILERGATILTSAGVNHDLPGTASVDEGTANFLDPRFDAELVDNFEGGLKGTLWGDRIQYGATAFYMLIDDFQLDKFTGYSFVPENVEAATTLGVEFEFQARPIEGLDIRGGVTWAQTDYDDGILDRVNVLTNERGFRLPGQELPEISNLAGRQLSNAPRWVETLSVTYTAPLPNTTLAAWAHFDFRIDSGYNTGGDLDPVKEQDGYTVVNGQLGLGHLEGRWEAVLWARNLLDKGYKQIAFDIPMQTNEGWGVFVADPRTFGVTLRGRF